MSEQVRQQETHCVAAQRQVLQRIYEAADYVLAEKNMHRSLELFGFRRSDGGREWFITNLAYLDITAAQFNMKIVFSSDARRELENAPATPCVSDGAGPSDAARKYILDIRAQMGRGKSLAESVRLMLERNPHDMEVIREAYDFFAGMKDLGRTE